MGILDRLRGNSKAGGMIGQYGLSDWWLTTFSPVERSHIEKTYDPSGSLTRGGPVTVTGANGEERKAVDLLTPLSGWFNNPRDSFPSPNAC